MTLLTQREAATLLKLSERTLERWRVAGDGPKFVRLGRSIRYRLTAIEESNEENSNEDDSSDEEESGNALPLQSSTSEDLTSMLENCAVDEIGKALEDADKLEEFEARVISRLTPDKVCGALTKAWPADQLRDLIKRLSTFVESLAATPSPPTAPSVTRRPVVVS